MVVLNHYGCNIILATEGLVALFRVSAPPGNLKVTIFIPTREWKQTHNSIRFILHIFNSSNKGKLLYLSFTINAETLLCDLILNQTLPCLLSFLPVHRSMICTLNYKWTYLSSRFRVVFFVFTYILCFIISVVAT